MMMSNTIKCALCIGIDWIEISPKYIKLSGSEKGWVDLLTDIGVIPGLAIRRVDHEFDSSALNSYTESIWNIQDFKRSPDSCYTVRDFQCTEFQLILSSIQLVKNNDIQVERVLKSLAKLLDSSWVDTYSNYTMVPYFDGKNTIELGRVISTFGYNLIHLPWISNITNNQLLIHKGCDLYIKSSKLTCLLHCHVPYVGEEFTCTQFLKFLKVKGEITHQEVFNLLCEWAEKPLFFTTIKHMINVYSYLCNNMEILVSTGIVEAFKEKPLLFVPSIEHWKSQSIDVTGSFVPIDTAVWKDKTTVLYNLLKQKISYPSHLPQILSYFYGSNDDYREIKNALTKLGLAQKFSIQNFIDIFEYNASITANPDSSQVENFHSVLEHMLDTLDSMNEFVCRATSLQIFPSEGNKWVTINDLYINDDPEIAKHFISKVNFIKWPFPDKNKLGKLLIPYLSRNVHTELSTTTVRDFNDLRISFHFIFPLIQRFIFSFNDTLPDEYHREIAQLLIKLKFFSTLELTCTYSLSGKHFANANIQSCQFDQKNDLSVIYIVVNTDSKIVDKSSLVSVICLILKSSSISVNLPEKINDFVQRLLIDDPRSENDQLLYVNKYDLKSISSDLSIWEVPLSENYGKSQKTLSNMVKEQKTEVQEDTSGDSDDDLLKAWPPKAPATLEKSTKSHDQSSKPFQHDRKITHKDVVTISEVQNQQNRNKRIEENPSVQVESKFPPAIKNESMSNFTTFNNTAFNDKHSDESSNQITHKHGNIKATTIPSTSTVRHTLEHSIAEPVDITSCMQPLPIQFMTTLEKMPNDDNKEEKLVVGQQGEKYVYDLLQYQMKLPNDIPIKNIKWINETCESGHPYDIMVISDDGTEYFIEVKSTKSHDKFFFAISWKEILFAKEKKKNYILFRVYGVSSGEKPSVKWMADFFQLIEDNPSLRLFINM
jgi:hypothetical protein